MEQFNLDTWLKDKSRKVVTRDGRSVRIISVDANNSNPIVSLIKSTSDGFEMVYQHTKDGKCAVPSADLFFADEEEELTELQKTLEEDCDCYVNLYNDGNTREELREWIKCWCHRIIDLARKELENSNPSNGNQRQEWSEDDEKELKVIISELKKYVMFNQYGTPLSVCDISWLEELPSKFTIQPQPKQEWSEEDEKLYTSALWHIKNSCGNGGNDSGEYEVYNWLKSIKDRVQPKQEWNEEDEKMWSQVINEIEAIKSNSSTIFEKNIAQDKIDWLNSIKDRVQPQPKQEWSEKDEHCIELLLPIIDSSSLIPKNRKKCKEFLKSLKDRVQPQPEQEWSEEDEKKINGLVKGLEDRMGFGWASQPFTREEYIELLKSLKDRVQPHPKQEWSEEDKSMYIRTLGILGKCYMGELPTEVEEELKWFKSITDKAQPQTNQYDKGYEDGYSAAKYNQWKPKKEELEALRKRTYFCEGIDANLDSLYTNLLKL